MRKTPGENQPVFKARIGCELRGAPRAARRSPKIVTGEQAEPKNSRGLVVKTHSCRSQSSSVPDRPDRPWGCIQSAARCVPVQDLLGEGGGGKARP